MPLLLKSYCVKQVGKPHLARMAKPKIISTRKCHTTSPINFWPPAHLRDAVKREAINSDRTITSILEELLAERYKLPLRLSGSLRTDTSK
jgi:hypothetical protein